MKYLTNFRKTVATGKDPRLLFVLMKMLCLKQW